MLKLENICYKNMFLDINLEVQNGEFVYVTGNNGIGKTTLINIISGIIKPTSGRILINNHNTSEITLHEKTELIPNLFQAPQQGTIAEMTIFENLNVAYKRGARQFCSIDSQTLRNYFKDKLSILNMRLEDRLDEYAGNISDL